MTKPASPPVGNPSLAAAVEDALAALRGAATRATLEGMARYGIPRDHALGVSMADLKRLAKRLGPNHALAEALWETGVYEARMLASLVGEPQRVTPELMDHWCDGFDSWAICDTVCFALFDRSPHAWSRVEAWSARDDEFGRRGAFALLACLALHDREAADAPFVDGLRLIERAATDPRNFVKKGVSWALRAIGERNAALNVAAVEVARRLAGSADGAARWVGRDALKKLASPAVARRLAERPGIVDAPTPEIA